MARKSAWPIHESSMCMPPISKKICDLYKQDRYYGKNAPQLQEALLRLKKGKNLLGSCVATLRRQNHAAQQTPSVPSPAESHGAPVPQQLRRQHDHGAS